MIIQFNIPCFQDVTGQAIVITGAASGLGKAMALRLAKKGAKIAVIDIDSVRIFIRMGGNA